MSRARKQAGLQRRITRLKTRISVAQSELKVLQNQASLMRANMLIAAMPAEHLGEIVNPLRSDRGHVYPLFDTDFPVE